MATRSRKKPRRRCRGGDARRTRYAAESMPTPAECLTTRFVQDAGYLFTQVATKDSGIDGVILWFAAGEFSARETERGPKLLVSIGDRLTVEALSDAVAVTLEDPPRTLTALPQALERQVVAFVVRNRYPLLR